MIFLKRLKKNTTLCGDYSSDMSLKYVMNLPDEMLDEILGFLNLEELVNIFSTSRRLGNFIQSSFSLKRILVQIHPKYDISIIEKRKNTKWGEVLAKLGRRRRFFSLKDKIATDLYIMYSRNRRVVFFFLDHSDKNYSYVEYLGRVLWKDDELADFHFQYFAVSISYGHGGYGSQKEVDFTIKNVQIPEDGEVVFSEEDTKKIIDLTQSKFRHHRIEKISCSRIEFGTMERFWNSFFCRRMRNKLKEDGYCFSFM